MTDKELAIRKINGVLQMIRIGNVQGFEICNMKKSEEMLRDALKLLKRDQEEA